PSPHPSAARLVYRPGAPPSLRTCAGAVSSAASAIQDRDTSRARGDDDGDDRTSDARQRRRSVATRRNDRHRRRSLFVAHAAWSSSRHARTEPGCPPPSSRRAYRTNHIDSSTRASHSGWLALHTERLVERPDDQPEEEGVEHREERGKQH